VLLGRDVIHLVREERCLLRSEAVLARAASAFVHQPPQRRGDVGQANLVEAALGAIASGNAELVATVQQKLPSAQALPPSIGALLQAAAG
jgi:hypothetical protein